MATAGKLSITKTNTNRYGLKYFKIHGALTLNDLKDQDIYRNARSKDDFLKKLKNKFIDNY